MLSNINDCIARAAGTTDVSGFLAAVPAAEPSVFQELNEDAGSDVIGHRWLPYFGVAANCMAPTSLAELSAVFAIANEGALAAGWHHRFAERKRCRVRAAGIHPEVDDHISEFVGDTFGMVLYQEQGMRILEHVTGWSLDHIDQLRRHMAKRHWNHLDEVFPSYLAAASDRGYSTGAAYALWDYLLVQLELAFTKSHCLGTALTSYWAAYAKRRFPQEYAVGLPA